MSFSKSKHRRSPLQRLSDQRRSLALAGLAAGAVLGGAVFRRRRRGVQDELRAQVPVAERPLGEADPGPPSAVVVPPPASEPEASEPLPEAVDTAINAAPGGAAAAAAKPESVAAPGDSDPAGEQKPAPAEPATGELSAEEASILAVLAQSGRADDDRTALAVATSLERDTVDVTAVLRKLGNEGVVAGELYTAAGDKIWAVTERGVRRLGAQH
ncbi:MAG: hypothetical protein QM729_04550 [Solirubrobacterales bacterium]